MKTMTEQLQTLARLLEYPVWSNADTPVRAVLWPDNGADRSVRVTDFARAFAALSQDEREELYTATFDVTPACVPYVSIHLFGEENFKRGEFMAALSARYAAAGFETRGELPDHLAVLLRFLAQTDEVERRELVRFCLLGPLGKMIAALAEENPYHALLEAVREVLVATYPDMQPAPSPLEQMQTHGANCNTAASACGGCSIAPQLEHSIAP